MILRTAKIPSILHEEFQQLHFKLLPVDESGYGFISVFTGFSSNERIAVLEFACINLEEQPSPLGGDVETNKDFPFIEEVRAAIKAIPVLAEQHAIELNFLGGSPEEKARNNDPVDHGEVFDSFFSRESETEYAGGRFAQ